MSLIEAASSGFKSMADGTVRFSFDVEPRHAEAALRLFRVPGTASVLAALVSGAAEPPAAKPKPKRERMTPLCEWAVLRCSESSFQEWIRPVYERAMGGDGMGTGDIATADVGGVVAYARHAILTICDIQSRKELDTDPGAAMTFDHTIRRPYLAWIKGGK